MPSTPVIQHQNTAPGPPIAMAVERPMIFPVPSVAASVVAREAKAPSPVFFFSLPRESFNAAGSFFCMPPVRQVK